MEKQLHHLTELFQQLGLPCEEGNIRQFLATHAPLASDIALADAPFWTSAQATFLREETLEDADWAPVIDRLNLLLRQGSTPRS